MPDDRVTRLTFLTAALALIALAVWAGFNVGNQLPAGAAPPIKKFSVPMGQVREPLKYRIVSFHRGRADKNLILLAKQLERKSVAIGIFPEM